jgi:hypothetical protein
MNTEEQKIIDSLKNKEVRDLIAYYLALKSTYTETITEFADLFDLFTIAKTGKPAVDVLPGKEVERLYFFSTYLERILKGEFDNSFFQKEIINKLIGEIEDRYN